MAVETIDARVVMPGPSRSAYWADIVFARTVPAVFFSIFLIDKFLQLRDAVLAVPARAQPTDYLAPFDQGLGLAYFALLVVLYVTRLPKRAGDARLPMAVVAFFGSFSVLAVSLVPGVPPRWYLLGLGAAGVTLGLVYTLWALAYLRRSFSIMPEARRLVTGGPYGFSRHPLYLGEGVAALGFVLPTISWAGLLLFTFFLLSQYLRIRAEERVLAGQFPEYAEYARRVPRYLPNPFRSWR